MILSYTNSFCSKLLSCFISWKIVWLWLLLWFLEVERPFMDLFMWYIGLKFNGSQCLLSHVLFANEILTFISILPMLYSYCRNMKLNLILHILLVGINVMTTLSPHPMLCYQSPHFSPITMTNLRRIKS